MVSFEQDDFTVDENLEEGIVLLSVVVSSELERTIELMLATVDGTAVGMTMYNYSLCKQSDKGKYLFLFQLEGTMKKQRCRSPLYRVTIK